MTSRLILMVICAVFVTSLCNAKESSMSDTKTYCFGRYLVDVPGDAQISGQAYEYNYGRIDVSEVSANQADFESQMRQREAELKSGKQKDNFIFVAGRRPSQVEEIFELSRKLITGPSTGFEAYKWDHGNTFSMQGVGYGPDKIQLVMSEIKNDVLAKLHFRDSNSIPAQPGFCLKNGFIADDGTTAQHEDAGISFKFARWPGVLVSVHSMTITKLGEPKLLARVDGAPVPSALQGVVGLIRTLRKGTRTVNGRDGEEILETYPTELGFRTHQFRWEAQGTQVGEALKPTLVVEFESVMFKDAQGNPLRPKLTDEQATQIFDAIVNSVRLRPTSGGKVSEVAPVPTLPLGTLAQTGSVCPQTGWWTCPEAVAHKIEGGGRQRFIAGSPMPGITVLGERNLIDRLLGVQPSYNVSTTWELVRSDETTEPDATGQSGMDPT